MTLERTRRQLSERQARQLTERIRATVETAWTMLLDAYEGGVAEVLGYKSWADYVQTEFGMSRSHAYRLVDWVKVVTQLEAASRPLEAETGVGVGAEVVESRDGTARRDAIAEAVTPTDAEVVKGVMPTLERSVRASVAKGTEPAVAVAKAVAKHTSSSERIRELRRAIETLVNAKEKDLKELGALQDYKTAAMIAGKLSSAAATIRGASKRDVTMRPK